MDSEQVGARRDSSRMGEFGGGSVCEECPQLFNNFLWHPTTLSHSSQGGSGVWMSVVPADGHFLLGPPLKSCSPRGPRPPCPKTTQNPQAPRSLQWRLKMNSCTLNGASVVKIRDFKKNFFLIYFWDRERQSMSRGGADRGGVTESEAGSRLWAVGTEPDAGLKLTDCEIMTWAKVGCLTDWATQAPLLHFYILIMKQQKEKLRKQSHLQLYQK